MRCPHHVPSIDQIRQMAGLPRPSTAQQAQVDQKAGGAQEPLLNGDAARQNGHDVGSDAAVRRVLVHSDAEHCTAAADQADSAAAPGKRRMSPFAWLLLAAAVRI